jgi:FMN reductase
MQLRVLAVSGSLKQNSVSRVAVERVADWMAQDGCAVTRLDLRRDPLPLYNPDLAGTVPGIAALRQTVAEADVFILGSPDYHGSVGSGLKNFLDYFWKEFAGKLMATIVASHEKGLTVTDQLRTIARQCYCWTLPYGVSLMEKADVAEGQIINPGAEQKLKMLARDARIYGTVLARQRQADLDCADSCFMAKLRP